MKKLRLLITKECPKRCEGCCNKDWNVDNLPIIDYRNYDFSQYSEVLLTGGEPLLNISLLLDVISNIRMSSQKTKIYVYTSWNSYPYVLFNVMNYVDGICYTIHEEKDSEFIELCEELDYRRVYKPEIYLSLRLNVFKGIEYNKELLSKRWKIKDNIEWIKNCPLPENEIFRRIK